MRVLFFDLHIVSVSFDEWMSATDDGDATGTQDVGESATSVITNLVEIS